MNAIGAKLHTTGSPKCGKKVLQISEKDWLPVNTWTVIEMCREIRRSERNLEYVAKADTAILIDFLTVGTRNDILFNVSNWHAMYSPTDESHSSVQMNKFIQDIDRIFRIDTESNDDKAIYHTLDIFITRICELLPSLDKTFSEVRLRLTGSVLAKTKIGLPHEADYIIEISRGSKANADRLMQAVGYILNNKRDVIFDGVQPSWSYHGIDQHKRSEGVCLYFSVQSSRENKEVGVKVDLVLAFKVELDQINSGDYLLTSAAEKYLDHDLEHYINQGDVFQLVGSSTWDAGIIENCILRDLPEGTKRAFCACKYLLQFLFPRDELMWPGTDNDDYFLNLYGFKPRIRSYFLREYFLHLLFQTRGTPLEKSLTDGTLVMCLLSMICFQYKTSRYFDVIDPVLIRLSMENPESIFDMYNAPPDLAVAKRMSEMIDKLLNEDDYIDVHNYRFVNAEENTLVSKEDRLKRGCFSIALSEFVVKESTRNRIRTASYNSGLLRRAETYHYSLFDY